MNQVDDYETLELIAQLHLMDLEEMKARLKGKGRGGTLSDAEITYNAMEAEARATLQIIRDQRIARGTERAIQEDLDLVDAMMAREAREQADHQYALALSINPNAPPPPVINPRPAQSSPSSIRSSTYSATSLFSSVASTTGSSPSRQYPASAGSSLYSPASSYAPTTSQKSQFFPSILRLPAGETSVDCVICSDPTAQAYQAPCGCFYDRNCLTELFTKATIDESLFPPRCCTKPISFDQVRSIFSAQLVRTFEKKSEEFKTPNRLYCYNPTCSAFLGHAAPTEREKVDKNCMSCYRSTCSFCKNAAHASYFSCKADTAAQQVLALGRQEGWQSCPSCHHMVELDVGCYHMTCRCRHEFCYICGQQWKSCTCPHWDETRLVTQAEQQVARGPGTLPVVARTQEIRRVVDNLRENHRCAHHLFGFLRRSRPGNCESCGDRGEFLLQCRGCSIQVCPRCRRNRL